MMEIKWWSAIEDVGSGTIQNAFLHKFIETKNGVAKIVENNCIQYLVYAVVFVVFQNLQIITAFWHWQV